jgi:hypothetical protein
VPEAVGLGFLDPLRGLLVFLHIVHRI